MSDDIRVRRRTLADYQRDPNNPHKATERGKRIVRDSLTEVGPARSAVASSDDVLLVGNTTADVAEELGMTEVIEIETDGDALIVHKRRNLASGDEKARLLRLLDNRASDFHDYQIDSLELDAADGLLDGLFRDDELLDLQIDTQIDADVNAAVDAAGEGGSRLKKDVKRAVKPVLYAEQVAVFEAALRRTGQVNRGAALIAVCQFYLDHAHAESE